MSPKKDSLKQTRELIDAFMILSHEGRKPYIAKLVQEGNAPEWLVGSYIDDVALSAKCSPFDYRIERLKNVAEMCVERGRSKKALELLVKAHETDRAISLAKDEGLVSELAKLYEREDRHYLLERLYERTGDYRKAVFHALRAGHLWSAFSNAQYCLSPEEFDKTVEEIFSITENGRGDRKEAGRIAEEVGDYKLAIKFYSHDWAENSRVIELAESHKQLPYLLDLYISGEKWHDALRVTRKIGSKKLKKKVCKKAAISLEEKGHFSWASDMWEKAGDKRKAKECFLIGIAQSLTGSLGVYPKEIEKAVRFGMGSLGVDIYLKYNKLLEASRLAKQTNDPRSDELYDRLIQVELKEVYFGSAIKLVLEKGDTPENHRRASKIYEKKGDYLNALEEARKGKCKKSALKKLFSHAKPELEQRSEYETLANLCKDIGDTEKEQFYKSLQKNTPNDSIMFFDEEELLD